MLRILSNTGHFCLLTCFIDFTSFSLFLIYYFLCLDEHIYILHILFKVWTDFFVVFLVPPIENDFLQQIHFKRNRPRRHTNLCRTLATGKDDSNDIAYIFAVEHTQNHELGLNLQKPIFLILSPSLNPRPPPALPHAHSRSHTNEARYVEEH